MLLSRHTQRKGQHDAGDAEVRVGDKASGGCRSAIAEAEEEGVGKGAVHREDQQVKGTAQQEDMKRWREEEDP